MGPHLPPAQVVATGSSVQALQRPVVRLQPNGQFGAATHCPLAPQVSELCALQRCELGGHTPPHRPVVESQIFVQVVPASYIPVDPQCLVTRFVQRSVPGTHSPAQVPLVGSQ